MLQLRERGELRQRVRVVGGGIRGSEARHVATYAVVVAEMLLGVCVHWLLQRRLLLVSSGVYTVDGTVDLHR